MADTSLVRKMIALQNSIVKEASAKTKSARREQQRSVNNARSKKPAELFFSGSVEKQIPTQAISAVDVDDWGDDADVTLYGGVA